MKFQLLSLLISLTITLPALAQPEFRVYSEPDNFKKGIRLMAEKTKPGSYTCLISFKQLMGYNCSEGADSFSATVTSYGPQQIAFLSPVENANSLGLSYTSTYLRGKNIAKPDSLFPYLLPTHPGKNMQTSGVQYVGNVIGKNSSDFYSMGFKYQLGDTICAARGGIVYEIFDKAESRKDNEYYSAKTRNSIFVEHNDGTLAQYHILSPIKMLVSAGDKVIPGQALAIFDQTDKDYTMLLSVLYLNLKAKSSSGTNYFNLKPRFVLATDQINLASPFTTYPMVAHPANIITKEMTNKEIKKLGLQH